MESIANQVRDLYTKANEDERRQILEDLRELQSSFDTEWDSVIKLGRGYLDMALVRIGTDLNIFSSLSASSTPITLGEFVRKSGAAPIMLGHILRGAAAFGLIKETGKDTFTANRLTRALSDPNVSGAIGHVSDVHAPVALALPSWLKERKYQNITSNTDLPFQQALKTELTPFDWMKQQPEQLKALGHAMAIQRAGHWIDSYPVEKEVGSFKPEVKSALLVDVGGGFGQQAIGFHTKYPSLPGRIIVQDIPETLDGAPEVEHVEFQAHDFFIEQPIKGAKFYYLRHVLHDWTDEESIRILKSIIPSMGPDSRIVIDEVVLPDEKLPWQCAFMDLMMMAALGGIERTRGEWENLLDNAGLKIMDVHKYDSKMQSVILAVPK